MLKSYKLSCVIEKKLGWLPRCGRMREKERVVQKKREKNTRGVKELPLTFVPECNIELPNLEGKSTWRNTFFFASLI